MRAQTSWSLAAAALTLLSAAPARGDKLRVQATLVELPKAPACTGRPLRVLCRYRLDRVLAGGRTPGGPDASSLWVVHRCPELARGPARIGVGDAPPLRPGQVHLLELVVYDGDIDTAAGAVPAEGMYQALRTDLAPAPPRLAVVLIGPAGAKVRLDFDAERVTAGRAADSDVLLNDRAVALRQLRLEVHDDQVVVTDLVPGRVRLNGAPLGKPRALSHRDTLSVGPFSLNVSLFHPREIPD